jgi:hypothetical protein
MKRTRLLLLAGSAAVVLASPAYADTIVYANSAGSSGIQIFNINVAAGTETLIGTIAQGGGVGALGTTGNGRGVVTVGNTLYYTYASSPNVYSYDLLTHTSNGITFTVAGASGLATMAWDGSSFWLGDYSGTNNAYHYSPTGTLLGTVSLSKCGEVHQGGIKGFCDGLEFANGNLVSNEGDGGFGGPSQYDVYSLSGGTPIQPGLITTTYGATGIAYDGTYYFVSDIQHDRLGVYDGSGAFVKFITLTDGLHTNAIEDLSVDYNIVLNSTPEPSTIMLLGTGMLGFLGVGYRRRRA